MTTTIPPILYHCITAAGTIYSLCNKRSLFRRKPRHTVCIALSPHCYWDARSVMVVDNSYSTAFVSHGTHPRPRFRWTTLRPTINIYSTTAQYVHPTHSSGDLQIDITRGKKGRFPTVACLLLPRTGSRADANSQACNRAPLSCKKVLQNIHQYRSGPLSHCRTPLVQ